MASTNSNPKTILQVNNADGLIVEFLLRRIPGGEFVMGSERGLPIAPEGPLHSVNIESFWIADAPVTSGQYAEIMGVNPARFQDSPHLPVESVTWHEAKLFCERLSKAGGIAARLPSEAEWEYACRAGSATQYYFGDRAAELGDYAWYELNAGERTSRVRRKKANAWGLFDMAGNVWEWCEDIWHEDYGGAPTDGSAWLESARTAEARRCVRGGSWSMDAWRCRSTYRSFDWETIGTSQTGFRVVVSGDSLSLAES